MEGFLLVLLGFLGFFRGRLTAQTVLVGTLSGAGPLFRGLYGPRRR